jgi:hypothetical protein
MSANRYVRRALITGAVATGTVLAAPAALAAPPVPAPVQQQTVEVTLDSAEIGSAPGTVVVSGTVTCTDPVEVFVFGDVAQVQGLDIARDFFFVDPSVQCSSTPTEWTATSFGALRVFLPLPTTINVSAQYCLTDVLCLTATASETLTLPAPADAGSSA